MINEEKASSQIKKSTKTRIYFLGMMIMLYIIFFIFWPQKTLQSLMISLHQFIELLPVLFFILVIMVLFNFYLKPQKVKKLLGKESGWKGWLIALLLGIIIHGSIYAWFPLLKELKAQGMRDGLVACFLYSRAVKIPLIPLMIYYFGLKFFLILLIFMLMSALIEGVIIEKI